MEGGGKPALSTNGGNEFWEEEEENMKSSCDVSGESPQSTAGGITVHAFKGVIIKGKEERGEKIGLRVVGEHGVKVLYRRT